MIPNDTIEKIFQEVKIEEIIGDFVALKKKGVNYIGNCPFHNEKTPSFTVSATKGIFKCFGCGVGGNAVKFIMDIEHYTYPEALKYIAKKYNIEVVEKEISKEQQEKNNKKESLYLITKFANKHFENTLWKNQEGVIVGLNYFKERGFNEKVIREFNLGYNTKDKNSLFDQFVKMGFDKELLVESGLIIKSNNNYFDRFRERVIFPIHSFSGRILGFGGRAFNGENKAKYLNSPESVIYYKSKILYGLFQSKSYISKENSCFIVEGYTDVISMHQNGVKNVVSASGTALGIDQIKLIRRITENITLLFDGDDAGIKATYRTINIALKESMNVNIVIFPKGEDPDSYSKKLNSKDYKVFLEKEKLNFVDYKILVSELFKKSDPKEIVDIKRDIFMSIASIPDSLTRSQYCKVYHNKLDITEKIMLEEIQSAKKSLHKNIRKETDNKKPKNLSLKKDSTIINKKTTSKLLNAEKEILRLLLNYGLKKFVFEKEEITVANMIITELAFDKIKLSNLLYKTIYSEIKNMIKENNKINIHNFINHENKLVSKLVVDLVSDKHSISDNWQEQHNIFTTREEEKLKRTTEKSILSLKKCHIDIKINQLQEQIKNDKISSNDIITLNKLTKLKNNFAKTLGRNIT